MPHRLRSRLVAPFATSDDSFRAATAVLLVPWTCADASSFAFNVPSSVLVLSHTHVA
eukprot:CAMPEP_0196768722 /NCGR_PEP_ID=MMETSP1104-20130614/60_1 /TAXON_ID=33652 /ORGANISM="Cafeteria sp., Strain Caron Lab Isolate" /LENGTH=56 /DNA_ID=CAMNT_0042138791 /DNA_START=26 /DNA_END=192 /DNA_ORIENTATION=+